MKREEAPEALCVWDVESSGVDIESDRIITAYAMTQRIDGSIIEEREWVINPGVDIPKGASDVHGMTTEWVAKNGRTDVEQAIREIAGFLDEASMAGYPIVGFNNSYDLGILDRELRRHGAVGLNVGLSSLTQFFDPIVYDRATDKYRKGKRKLIDVAKAYGIEIDETRLHDAKYDVIITAKLAWLQLQKSKPNMSQLQGLQKQWKADWATHLTEYFDSIGQREDDGSKIEVDGSFPYKPFANVSGSK